MSELRISNLKINSGSYPELVEELSQVAPGHRPERLRLLASIGLMLTRAGISKEVAMRSTESLGPIEGDKTQGRLKGGNSQPVGAEREDISPAPSEAKPDTEIFTPNRNTATESETNQASPTREHDDKPSESTLSKELSGSVKPRW